MRVTEVSFMKNKHNRQKWGKIKIMLECYRDKWYNVITITRRGWFAGQLYWLMSPPSFRTYKAKSSMIDGMLLFAILRWDMTAKYRHISSLNGHFIPGNDQINDINWLSLCNIVKYHKNKWIWSGLETLFIVNMNKLLSNAKISLECYRGKC